MRIADLLFQTENDLQEGDNFDIELEDLVIESYVVGFTHDGIVVASDDTVLSYIKTEELTEAEYHGKQVPLGKPFYTPEGPKKRSVYVKNPKTGNIKKINFGQKGVKIKKSNPKRRKSFRARHRCENPGPRTSARYWSCKFW